MASWTDLSGSTLYSTLLAQINDRGVDSAYAFDPASTTVTSPKTNHVRFNSANKRWEKYNGSSWIELIVAASDAYAMTATGLRGGNIYGTVSASGATVNGGAFDVTTLKRGGSDAWTVASLTNLNQLANGPSYITAAALTSYALLASPNFSGTPQIAGAAIATQSYVTGLGYLTAAAAASTYAPLGGAGTSGTWGISISGNSLTTSQRTFSNVRTDGINRGSYGSISVAGSTGGYAGIDFTTANVTFMVNTSTGLSGIYKESVTQWLWYFDGAGVLTVGTVPWARVTGGAAPNVSTFPNDSGYALAAGQAFGGVVSAAQLAVPSSGVNGRATLSPGDGSHSGYVEFTHGTRQHYIGYVTAGGALNFQADNAAGWSFSGGGNLTCSGLLVGRSGGLGLGRITTTTSTGSPAGTSAGDLVLVY